MRAEIVIFLFFLKEIYHEVFHAQSFLIFISQWVLLNRAPTSTQLISISAQLHPPSPSSFQPPPSGLENPQRY